MTEPVPRVEGQTSFEADCDDNAAVDNVAEHKVIAAFARAPDNTLVKG